MALIDMLLYAILSVGVVVLASYVVVVRRKYHTTLLQLMQAGIDKQLLITKLSEALDTIHQKPVEQTDGFMKFMTDSRDFAFSFIETMQEALAEFENETKDILSKDEMSSDIAKVSKAFQKLKEKTLPDDIPNN